VDRRVAQPEGERLGLGALDPLVARLLAQPPAEIVEVLLLLGRRLRQRLDVAPEREQVHVDRDQPIRISKPQSGSYEPAPVAALGREAAMAEHVGHQGGEGIRDLGDAEARLAGPEGEAVAGQRRRDHREGVRGIAPEAGRVGEHRQDLVELPDRAGPAVREQERQRPGTAPLLVDEVQVDAGHLGRELAEAVEPRLVRAPVVAVLPVRDQVLHVGEARAEGPLGAGGLVGPPHAGQALAQIGERRVGNLDPEGPGLHQNTGLSM
jgi:hypothetical protein